MELKTNLDSIIEDLEIGGTKQYDRNMFVFYAMLLRGINYVNDHLTYNDNEYNTQAIMDHFQEALSACQRDYDKELDGLGLSGSI